MTQQLTLQLSQNRARQCATHSTLY